MAHLHTARPHWRMSPPLVLVFFLFWVCFILGSQSRRDPGRAAHLTEKPGRECESQPTSGLQPLQVGERVHGSRAPATRFPLQENHDFDHQIWTIWRAIWVFGTTLTLFSLLLSFLSLYPPFSTLNPFIHYLFSVFIIICFFVCYIGISYYLNTLNNTLNLSSVTLNL